MFLSLLSAFTFPPTFVQTETINMYGLLTKMYILLTKHEGRTGRISARGLDSTDRAQRGPYKKDQGPIFSQDGPEKAWLITDLLYDQNCLEKNPNDRLQRHHKLQARNFCLEQTERLLTSDVFKKKKNKVGRKQK